LGDIVKFDTFMDLNGDSRVQQPLRPDIVLKALKPYRQCKRFKVDYLMHFARICRMKKVMRTYLEAML